MVFGEKFCPSSALTNKSFACVVEISSLIRCMLHPGDFWESHAAASKIIGYNQQYFNYKPKGDRPQQPRRAGGIGYNG